MNTLIAINPCILENTGEPTLTIGKEYPILWQDEEELIVWDDREGEHYFSKDRLSEFFTVKE